MQALVITAYKDMNQLLNIIDEVRDRCWIYIHLDKKADFYSKLEEEISKRNSNRVHLESTYSVVWGGYCHLLAILRLLGKALANPDVNYLHIISGQDFFTRGFATLELEFDACEKIYMTCCNVKECDDKVRERLYYPIISANLNAQNPFIRAINICTTIAQKIIRHKRIKLGTFNEIYKGMIWVSLPRKAAQYVVEFSEANPLFLKSLEHTFIPEEFFFQTILMNSTYAKDIVKNNLRYTVWEPRNGICPAILDVTDYENIIHSDAIFARKIDSSISKELLKRLK